MAEGQEGAEAALEPIPLTVAAEPTQAPPLPRRGFAVPRIVDYLVVAIFMYFTL